MRIGSLLAGLLLLLLRPALAADADHGRALFRTFCSVCHVAEKGAGNRIGPNLYGGVGRRAGTVPNFAYSQAIRDAAFTLSEEELKLWLAAPAKRVPGTRMSFGGLASPADRDDLVAYLAMLRD